MKYNYKVQNIELEYGIELLSKTVTKLSNTEIVPIDNSLGRILSNDITAKHNNPPFNRSAIDGYALKASDLNNYRVVGELCAGDSTAFKVGDGECVRIMTGAEIPHDCDCCVRQEDVTVDGINIIINKVIKKYDNYVFSGEDFKSGQLLLSRGTKLSFVEIGILASAGYYEVEVFIKPKVAIISTGDEVIMPFEELSKSKIYNSNIYMIEGRLNELGISNVYKQHIIDSPDAIYNEIAHLSTKYDLIITTGGVSVGKKDILHDVVQNLEITQLFWRLKIQPGTPIMCSMYKNTPIISLSGNPFASLVNFELVVREVLYLLYSDTCFKTRRLPAILESTFNKKSKNRRFIRANYEDGKVFIDTTQHSSSIISSLINCNCLIEIKENTEFLSKGDKVNVILI